MGAILYSMGYFEHLGLPQSFTTGYLLQQRHLTKKRKKKKEKEMNEYYKLYIHELIMYVWDIPSRRQL
jgi:hypothetical protein